jgi:pre-rRNA-processing protein TSR3
MEAFPPTLILRHRRENLKKCSLRGLEGREDLRFFTYPREALPPLTGYVVLSLGAPELSQADCDQGIVLIDGTWRHARTMRGTLPPGCVERSLPRHFVTAYPRRQHDCEDPSRGLASVEALYIAYTLLGRKVEGLLDHYHWKEPFLAGLDFLERRRLP